MPHRSADGNAGCVRAARAGQGTRRGVYKIRALNGGTWIRVPPDGRRQCVRCSEQLTRMRAKAERAMRAAEPRDHCCRRTHRSATPLTPLTQISEQKQANKHTNMRTNKRNKTKRSSRTNERSRPGEAEAKFTLAVRRIAREACAPTWHAFTATRIFQSVSPGSARVTGLQTTRDADSPARGQPSLRAGMRAWASGDCSRHGWWRRRRLEGAAACKGQGWTSSSSQSTRLKYSEYPGGGWKAPRLVRRARPGGMLSAACGPCPPE
jgi:hypothetical protein